MKKILALIIMANIAISLLSHQIETLQSKHEWTGLIGGLGCGKTG